MEIRLSDLQGKEVTTLTGERLGRIANLIVESTTGELDKLLIDSDGIAPEGTELDSSGLLSIPFTSVRSVKDMVMVKI